MTSKANFEDEYHNDVPRPHKPTILVLATI